MNAFTASKTLFGTFLKFDGPNSKVKHCMTAVIDGTQGLLTSSKDSWNRKSFSEKNVS